MILGSQRIMKSLANHSTSIFYRSMVIFEGASYLNGLLQLTSGGLAEACSPRGPDGSPGPSPRLWIVSNRIVLLRHVTPICDEGVKALKQYCLGCTVEPRCPPLDYSKL